MLSTQDIMYLAYMEECEKEAERQKQQANYSQVNNELYEDLEPERTSYNPNRQ